MSTTAISDPRGDGSAPGARGEMAPSLMREDDLFFPRLVGLVAATLVTFGAVVLILLRIGRVPPVSPASAALALTARLLGLMYHAAFDRDIQFRRVYMVFGFLAVVVGGILATVPYPVTAPLKWWQQFGPGFLCMFLGLVFLLCFLRNETEENVRSNTLL